jgi:hypothetical protein
LLVDFDNDKEINIVYLDINLFGFDIFENMKKYIKTFLFVGFSIVLVTSTCLISSCTKDATTLAGNTNGQYLNSKNGSSWVYTIDSAGNTSMVEVTDSTVLSFGKRFTNFHNTYPSGTVYRNFYAYQDGQYSMVITSSAGLQQELIYLKDKVMVGDKWSSVITPLTVPFNYDYEVKGIGLTHMVNGNTFNQVVWVHCNVSSGSTVTYQSDAYYAPKVGLIQLEENYTTANYSTKLKSYTLK